MHFHQWNGFVASRNLQFNFWFFLGCFGLCTAFARQSTHIQYVWKNLNHDPFGISTTIFTYKVIAICKWVSFMSHQTKWRCWLNPTIGCLFWIILPVGESIDICCAFIFAFHLFRSIQRRFIQWIIITAIQICEWATQSLFVCFAFARIWGKS